MLVSRCQQKRAYKARLPKNRRRGFQPRNSGEGQALALREKARPGARSARACPSQTSVKSEPGEGQALALR